MIALKQKRPAVLMMRIGLQRMFYFSFLMARIQLTKWNKPHDTLLHNLRKHFSNVKGEMSDSFTNYNYVGITKVSVSIKQTYANKCTLSEIFLTEILKSFSVF